MTATLKVQVKSATEQAPTSDADAVAAAPGTEDKKPAVSKYAKKKA